MNPNIRKTIFVLCFLLLVRWLIGWLAGGDTESARNQAAFENLSKDIALFSGGKCNILSGEKCLPGSDDKQLKFIPSSGLHAGVNGFLLDNKPFTIISGSFHYFRTQPAQWHDRLLKMKAAGLNTVTTYIPWNLHEPVPGQYKFEGRWDIVRFTKLVHTVGLKLIIRPGPYICAEWDYGGLPHWLLSDPRMQVRRFSYKPFLSKVEQYFSKLLPLFAPLQYTNGGAIIAFQVENEYGSYATDLPYLRWVKTIFEKYGLKELFFTSDGPGHLRNGTLPEIYATVNFMRNPDHALDALKTFQPNKPLMVTEFWSGWFDHWGDPFHHTTTVTDFIETVDFILRSNSSINFYMFVGGTNFEFWNGANNDTKIGYEPTVTSYDYNAPISESGDVTEKCRELRKLLLSLGLAKDLPDFPKDPPKMYYGKVVMEQSLAYENVILLSEKTSSLPQPFAMEMLDINNHAGQGFGFILYRTQIAENTARVQIHGRMLDRGMIMQDSTPKATYDWRTNHSTEIAVIDHPFSSTLDFFVENMGRVNYKFHLDRQRKGFFGHIKTNGNAHVGKWLHVALEFDENFNERLSKSAKWQKYMFLSNPSAYRAYFSITDEPRDTFISMAGWEKGIVIINGYNLGRYWRIGPHETLYVPASLLQTGKNEVIIFELSKPGEYVRFVDKPSLGAIMND